MKLSCSIRTCNFRRSQFHFDFSFNFAHWSVICPSLGLIQRAHESVTASSFKVLVQVEMKRSVDLAQKVSSADLWCQEKCWLPHMVISHMWKVNEMRENIRRYKNLSGIWYLILQSHGAKCPNFPLTSMVAEMTPHFLVWVQTLYTPPVRCHFSGNVTNSWKALEKSVFIQGSAGVTCIKMVSRALGSY